MLPSSFLITAVSGKTTFLVVGNNAGATKQTKAKEIGTYILSEEALCRLIKIRSDRIAPTKVLQKPKVTEVKSESFVPPASDTRELGRSVVYAYFFQNFKNLEVCLRKLIFYNISK